MHAVGRAPILLEAQDVEPYLVAHPAVVRAQGLQLQPFHEVVADDDERGAHGSQEIVLVSRLGSAAMSASSNRIGRSCFCDHIWV